MTVERIVGHVFHGPPLGGTPYPLHHGRGLECVSQVPGGFHLSGHTPGVKEQGVVGKNGDLHLQLKPFQLGWQRPRRGS